MEMLKNDIAEVAPKEMSIGKTYYMPHRAVYKQESTTTKMRIVFDASSSKEECLSLNEHLYAGENFYNNLLTVLLNFRSKNIAVVADVEKAFLQIIVDEQDRDAQRFFWFKGLPKVNAELPDVVVYRMKRVTFGITSSPYLLASTIENHLSINEEQHPEICQLLQRSFYVDDLVTSVDTEQKAIDLYTTSSSIMKSGGFHLRKWISNSHKLNEYFNENNCGVQGDCHKVLGLMWNSASDILMINLEEMVTNLTDLPPTKRGVMQSMGRIYDPLGLLGPFVVNIKILLQSIWKLNLEWDDLLPEQLEKKFIEWENDIEVASKISMPRRFTQELNSQYELHVFADASPHAYGAVAYLREVMTSGKIQTTLICAKNRVSPLNKNAENELTLPKLELKAALIGKENLNIKIDKIIFWTDSSIVLYWITGNKTKRNIQNYVRARVNEINRITNIYDWRHCNVKENPADLLTRGMKGGQLANSAWFKDDISKWPSNKFTPCLNIVEEEADEVADPVPLLNLNNYSGIKRVYRITAYVLKFVNCLKMKCKMLNARSVHKSLSTRELKAAETYWIKNQQEQYFKDEVSALKANKPISKGSKIITLNPVLSNGILILSSRLKSNSFDELQRQPIILPKQSKLTELLVREAHAKLMHGGVATVLTHLRKKFWIIKGRQLIKVIIHQCIICKRLNGKSANEPWTALPFERISTSRPFDTVGGPFVRQNA